MKTHDRMLDKDTLECIETLFEKLEFSLEKELDSYRQQEKPIHKISALSKEIKIKNTCFKIRIYFLEKDILSINIINNDKFYRKNANQICPDCNSSDTKLGKVDTHQIESVIWDVYRLKCNECLRTYYTLYK